MLEYEKKSEASKKVIQELENRMTATVALLHTEKNDLTQEPNASQQQNAQLKSDLAGLRGQMEDEKARKDADLEASADEVKMARQQRADLENKLTEARHTQEAQLQSEEKQKRLQTELNALKQQKDQLAVDLGTIMEQIEVLQVGHEQEQSELSEELSASKKHADLLAADLNKAKEHFKFECEKQAQRARTNLKALEKINDAIVEENGELRNKNEALRRHSTHTADERAELDSVKSERDQLAQNNQWLKSEIAKVLPHVQALLWEKTAMSAELEVLRESNSALQAAFDAKCKVLAKAQEELADEKGDRNRWLERRNELVQGMQVEIERLRKSEAAAWQQNYCEGRNLRQQAGGQWMEALYVEHIQLSAQRESDEYVWANILSLRESVLKELQDVQQALEKSDSHVEHLQGIIDGELDALKCKFGGFRAMAKLNSAADLDATGHKNSSTSQRSSPETGPIDSTAALPSSGCAHVVGPAKSEDSGTTPPAVHSPPAASYAPNNATDSPPTSTKDHTQQAHTQVSDPPNQSPTTNA